MAAHKWAEVIKAWAEGAEIQGRPEQDAGNDKYWTDQDDPRWYPTWQYRIKPAEPERVYPEVYTTEQEVIAAWTPPYGWKGLRDFANKALRHAIDNGQVVTREEFDKLDAQYKETAELLRYTREKLQAAILGGKQ